MRDPYSIPVISKGTCERVVGNDTLVKEAEEAGVIDFHTTPTGRQNTSPRGFKALLGYVHDRSETSVLERHKKTPRSRPSRVPES